MLFDILAEFSTVDDAAKAMAGNWQTWRNFVWFGSEEVPNSPDVMLGYLVNNESTLRQLANLRFARHKLASYWGNLTQGALVGDYGADFHGDANLLSGLMCRVYQRGKITEPFRKLYEIAKTLKNSHDGVIDQETFKRVQREEFAKYVRGELGYQCGKRHIEFSETLAAQVADELISDEVDFDNDDVSLEISKLMGWESDDDMA